MSKEGLYRFNFYEILSKMIENFKKLGLALKVNTFLETMVVDEICGV